MVVSFTTARGFSFEAFSESQLHDQFWYRCRTRKNQQNETVISFYLLTNLYFGTEYYNKMFLYPNNDGFNILLLSIDPSVEEKIELPNNKLLESKLPAANEDHS